MLVRRYSTPLLCAATAALFFVAIDAAADLTPPCCAFATTADCSSPDAACPSGGTCRTAKCGNGSSSVDKCLACPVLVTTDGGECTDPSQIGRSCGTGGTCQRTPLYCGQTYVACVGALDWDAQPPLNSSCIDGVDAASPDGGSADSGPVADGGSGGSTQSGGGGGGGGGCGIGASDASSIALAWLFAALAPAALRRAVGARRRR